MYKIEYNFISKGTERQSNIRGYMAVTKPIDNIRFICPVSHVVSYVKNCKNALIVNTRDDLSTICLARFLLPSYLFFKNNKFNKNSKILVIGYGCIGYATVLCLLKFGFKNIVCFYRNNIENVRLKNIEYIDKLENLNNFNLIIDCTGEIKLIRHILINSLYFSKIILLGTPREMGSNELLLVHRKNLVVYGAHEIFGYTNIQRQKSFNQCLKIIRNLKLNYSKIVGFTYTLDKIPLTKYVILKRS